MGLRYVVEHEKFGGEYPLEKLTFGEALQFEKVTGVPWDEARAGGLRAEMGMLYTAIRKVHPDFTWADLEEIEMTSARSEVEDDEPDPTPPADDAEPSQSDV